MVVHGGGAVWSLGIVLLESLLGRHPLADDARGGFAALISSLMVRTEIMKGGRDLP